MSNTLLKYDYAELRTRCRAISETDEGGMQRFSSLGKCGYPKAFSLRRRWAALAARMRCRLRSSRYHNKLKGNAAVAATTLTIRHSRFATLTLAKLVASLALHPPISATGSGGLRASPPLTAEPLLKEKPFGECVSQQSPIVVHDFRTQSRPVARRCNRRGLAKPDHEGKQETNGGKLAFIRVVQAFTCHGGR